MRLSSFSYLQCICLVTMISCQQQADKNEIVLVVAPEAAEMLKGSDAQVKYSDDSLLFHVVRLDAADKHIRINSPGFVEIGFKSLDGINRSTLLKNGDSVVLTAMTDIILLHVVNRSTAPLDINFIVKKDEILYGGHQSTMDKFYEFARLINSPYSGLSNDAEMQKDLETLKKTAVADLQKEDNFIDSLFASGDLSSKYAEFYHSKNKFELTRISLYKNGIPDFTDLKIFRNHPQFSFYDDLLALYVQSGASSDTSYLDHGSQQQILLKATDRTLPMLEVTEKRIFLEKLRPTLDYPSWIEFLERKHIDQTLLSPEIYLVNKHNEHAAANAVALNHRGKIIYLDLWAGWCLPCLIELKESAILADEYKDRVSFIYFSLDHDFQSWRQSEKKYLPFNEIDGSFYIDSVTQTKMRTDFGVSSIPRYQVYDVNGNLVHGNAPRPGTSEIRKLLDTYLSTNQTIN